MTFKIWRKKNVARLKLLIRPSSYFCIRIVKLIETECKDMRYFLIRKIFRIKISKIFLNPFLTLLQLRSNIPV